MSDSQDPLKVVAYSDGEVRGEARDRVVLPLLLNRLPTDWESRASVARDAVGHLSTDTLELRYSIHPSTDIKTAVDSVQKTLAVISSEALKLEEKATQTAENRTNGANAAANKIREGLRDAGLSPSDN